jgi:hypothetical protein
LLLLKQTMDASYDPGPLQLNGPNVSITAIEQILSKGAAKKDQAKSFRVGFRINATDVEICFGKDSKGDLRVMEMTGFFFPEQTESITLREGMTGSQLERLVPAEIIDAFGPPRRYREGPQPYRLTVMRERSFLAPVWTRFGDSGGQPTIGLAFSHTDSGIERELARIIHLPALRGNPRRTYRTAAIEERYPGTFDTYTAGVIAAWQGGGRIEKLNQLRVDLDELGLTWKVEARQLDDTQVELLVGRLPHARPGGARDLVNIADVGFGVSQTLPVIVALNAALPGQLVYLEQPEIHLHPRAQVKFANLVCRALARGVRVIVETHSALFIRAIQTLVATGQLDQHSVVLHWFTRDAKSGDTQISSGELDRSGAFGDWPEDFDEVYLESESAYLNAATKGLAVA